MQKGIIRPVADAKHKTNRMFLSHTQIHNTFVHVLLEMCVFIFNIQHSLPLNGCTHTTHQVYFRAQGSPGINSLDCIWEI